MASLVLGGIGGYLFGPIGFAVGSALGALLDPQKQEGPRMKDKHLQGSSYGEPIPIVYGTMRLAGEVIWTTELQEHKNTSGGKGGPEITTYTYSASFSVLLCESPVLGVLRIWADSTLIWDTTGGSGVDNSQIPVTIYLGEATQDPDPTEEAVLGVGNVPAYRGICRMVFDDWDLGTWGNRIPQLTAEVFTVGGDIPWRVSLFDPFPDVLNSVLLPAIYADGQITTAAWNSPFTGPTMYMNKFSIDGTNSFSSSAPLTGMRIINYIANLLSVGTVLPSGTEYHWASYDADLDQYVQGAEVPGMETNGTKAVGNPNIYQNGSVYTVAGSGGTGTLIGRYNAAGGIPNDGFNGTYELDAFYAASNVGLGTSDDGHIYVCVQTGGGGGGAKLWKLDEDLNLVHFWDVSDTAGTRLRGSEHNFHVYKGLICNNYTTGGLWYVSLVKITGTTLADYGTTIPHTKGGMTNLTGGLMLDQDGVFSLDPPAGPAILGDIVLDISQRCGLDATETPDLPDSLPQTVPGFMIPRQSTGRDNLMQLRTAYFWDAGESSAAMKFVNRGSASVITIADNDLAAQPGDTGIPPPLVTVKRQQEVDLPNTVWVAYFNFEADFQNGTQYARRLVTQSQANARVDLSIALYDVDAAAIANKLLYQTWLERTGLIILTSRKFSWYEPTDVITAHGYTFRVTDKRMVASDIVQLEGVLTNTGVWVAAPPGVPGSGFDPPILNPKQPSELVLMDVPLAIDTDMENGAYAGMGPEAGSTGVWPGASLYKSADGGSNYSDVGTLTVATIIGTADTELAPFYGGNMVDEINSIDVTLSDTTRVLTSVTLLDLLGGANLALIGLEYVQFQTATLTAPGQYTLTSLLRGRRGTEWAMQGHNAGEEFVVYPFLNFSITPSELSLSRTYKPVTLNTSLAAATSQDFTSYGEALRPYQPVQLGGGVDASDNVTLTWYRRTRKGGAWNDFTDVPLSEPTESYVVQIWDSTYTVCARVITGITTTSCPYSAANQVTDFGATQQTIYWTVGQLGVYTLGVQARGATPGGGATDDAPLNPQPPYNGSPIPPSGGGSVNATLSYPSDVDFSSGFKIGDTWVAKFTVGGSPPTGGYISVAEISGPQYMRHLRLCTDVNGTSLVPNGEIWGNVATLMFGSGAGKCNLSAATDYYLIITNQLPNGDPSGVPGTSANIGVTLTAV